MARFTDQLSEEFLNEDTAGSMKEALSDASSELQRLQSLADRLAKHPDSEALFAKALKPLNTAIAGLTKAREILVTR